jgi:hypothetical protein
MQRRTLPILLLALSVHAIGQTDLYPHNAANCERCHSVPIKFGGSAMTVERMGESIYGKFAPASEGGLHHRSGESAQGSASGKQIIGERVSLSLLGDGYIEAIDNRDIEQNTRQQRQANLGIGGVVVSAPLLEGAWAPAKMQTGRFGWKSQGRTQEEPEEPGDRRDVHRFFPRAEQPTVSRFFER